MANPGTAYPGSSGNRLDGCFALIQDGKQEHVLREAKTVLKEDRWDPRAYACFSMACYSLGKTERAVRKLREMEDSAPQDVVVAAHDIIWNYMPELLAEKEYNDNYPVAGGDCLLRNVQALQGSGYLIIGSYFNPYNSSVSRHIRGLRCAPAGCDDIDLVCPACLLREAETVIEVRNYRIKDVQDITGKALTRNVRYIEKVLEIQRR